MHSFMRETGRALGAAALLFCGLVSSASADMVTGSFTAGDPTMPNRLFRDGIPSVFTSPKPFPGTFPEVSFFDTFAFVNPNPVATPFFVTTTTDPQHEFNAFFSVYLGSFNPNNLAQNYLGDAGASGLTTSFSVLAPPNATLIVVANSVGGTGPNVIGTTYTIDTNFPQVGAIPEPATLTLISLGSAGLLGYAWRRRRTA